MKEVGSIFSFRMRNGMIRGVSLECRMEGRWVSRLAV